MKDFLDYSSDYIDLFSKIKLVVSDNDGVLTDGKIYFSDDDTPYCAFNAKDGFGIKCLQSAGIEFAIISGRKSNALSNRAKALKIEHIYTGVLDKKTEIKKLISKFGFSKDEVLFIGDDFIDLPAMEEVGVKVAVADSHPMLIANGVDYVTLNDGGKGAVREVCDLILISQGKLEHFTDWLFNKH